MAPFFISIGLPAAANVPLAILALVRVVPSPVVPIMRAAPCSMVVTILAGNHTAHNEGQRPPWRLIIVAAIEVPAIAIGDPATVAVTHIRPLAILTHAMIGVKICEHDIIAAGRLAHSDRHRIGWQ